MTTARTDDPASDAARPPPSAASPRPPVVAMVVVGLLGLAILGLFLRSGGLGTESFSTSLLDDDEQVVGPGQVQLDLGTAVVRTELSTTWVRRQRCPGWVQLTSMDGDATRVHVIATPGAPDPTVGRLVEVDDYGSWLASQAGLVQAPATETSVLGVPATAGTLVAGADAPRDALVAACAEAGGTGIRGPAAGFEQDLVVTTGRVQGLGHVLVVGSAWVGGDVEVARTEARSVAASLALVEPES